MTWYNCEGIPDFVCMLKGVLAVLVLFIIGNGLDELFNRKKYKNERDLKKIENKKIKEIMEKEEAPNHDVYIVDKKEKSHSLGEDKTKTKGRINPDVKRN